MRDYIKAPFHWTSRPFSCGCVGSSENYNAAERGIPASLHTAGADPGFWSGGGPSGVLTEGGDPDPKHLAHFSDFFSFLRGGQQGLQRQVHFVRLGREDDLAAGPARLHW